MHSSNLTSRSQQPLNEMLRNASRINTMLSALEIAHSILKHAAEEQQLLLPARQQSPLLSDTAVTTSASLPRAELQQAAARSSQPGPASMRKRKSPKSNAAGSTTHASMRAQARLAKKQPRAPKQPTVEMDYDSFWPVMHARARASLHTLGAGPSELERLPNRWPKVYIYDLPQPLSEGWHPSNATIDQVFGQRFNWNDKTLTRAGYKQLTELVSGAQRATLSKHVRNTNHYSFARAFLYRLWNSPHYRTRNPADADIFYAPISPLPKRGKYITEVCKAINGSYIANALMPHFNEQTAHKHLFVWSKEHYEAMDCTGWWGNPKSLFKRVMRLAYSPVASEQQRPDDYYPPEYGCHTLFAKSGCPTYPNLESVPYISNVHWPAAQRFASNGGSFLARTRMHGDEMTPWSDTRSRHFSMLFLGGSGHGDTQVRRKLWAMCTGYNSPVKCLASRYTVNSLLYKYTSTFCLEPAGDSPYRRSTTDSIAFGCIPVFLSSMQTNVYGWLWGGNQAGRLNESGWEHAASIHINRTAFLNDEVNVSRLLESIPSELLALMRRILAQHARKFTVALEDDEGDQVHALLLGAWRTSRRLGREKVLPGWSLRDD